MTTTSESGGSVKIRLDEVNSAVSGPCEHFDRYDELRGEGRAHFGDANGHDFWMLTRQRDMLAVFQDPATFSSRSVTPEDPDPPYLWIPEMLDPPIHTKWRQLIGRFFAPGAVSRLEPKVRQRFTEILDDIEHRGRCDFVADVALRFPNTIFMEIMGLPVSDAEQFQVWETAILHAGPTHHEQAFRAMQEVMAYFSALIDDRRAAPREDLISSAMTWQIDDEPVSDGDLLAFCLLMFMAGLDTVAMQLSYSFYHLARNPDDRRRIAEDLSLVQPAVEEFLRYYAFVSPGRKATKDIEIAGCRVKAGQMMWMPLASANRDEDEFPDADRVIIDRSPNRHLAFGAGPHRCLGSHLARQELTIGLSEWHKRIPDYRLDPDIPVTEHGGQVGLDNLPLVWDAH
ncbi:MAG TPA: cytochrome P450 [Amycolatopsis sp.]|nr:cytochrome P450 [Amycolatopsis sp.]